MREQIQLQVHRTWRIEGVRAKLKRLVSRGALREDGPGLFALAADPEHTQPR